MTVDHPFTVLTIICRTLHVLSRDVLDRSGFTVITTLTLWDRIVLWMLFNFDTTMIILDLYVR